jgi:hypothetical protein
VAQKNNGSGLGGGGSSGGAGDNDGKNEDANSKSHYWYPLVKIDWQKSRPLPAQIIGHQSRQFTLPCRDIQKVTDYGYLCTAFREKYASVFPPLSSAVLRHSEAFRMLK